MSQLKYSGKESIMTKDIVVYRNNKVIWQLIPTFPSYIYSALHMDVSFYFILIPITAPKREDEEILNSGF